MTDQGAPAGPPARRWHLSLGVLSTGAAGTALILLGLLAGRPDVSALGAPLVLAVLWGLPHTPTDEVDVALGPARFVPGGSRIEATLELDPVPGAVASQLRILTPDHEDVHALIDARTPRRVRLSMITARTGRQEAFELKHQEISARALHRSDLGSVRPATLLVLPLGEPLGAMPVPARLIGLTGAHRSTRPGDGGDLRDVATFAAGDRLRRIDWKSTARHATGGARVPELYVRRTFATAEAHLMLVLDSRDAVGPDVATWGTGEVHPYDATSLDIARRAGAALARRYLDQGDRVGLVDLGRHRRPLRPAAGRRHLDRILHHLAVAEPDGQLTSHLRAPQIPSGALVIVLSTFLDGEAAEMAQSWRHAGHRTVAVDVLPRLVLDRLPPASLTAFRLLRMERNDRLAELAASGVELIPWGSAGAADGAADDAGEDVGVAWATLARARRHA